MATEAFRLKVSKEKYQQTISDLDGQIESLKGKQTQLKALIGQLVGDTYSGSDVQSSIDLANEALRRVDKAITKITSEKDTIQEYLDTTESDATFIQGKVTEIQGDLPDLFK